VKEIKAQRYHFIYNFVPKSIFRLNMERFITAGGIAVHILDSEKGEKCIILLHGYLETMYIWSEFADLLSRQYRVIVMDIPGHGLTDYAPADTMGNRINTMDFCASVVKEVLDKCSVSKAVIGGHSLGGYIALACCRLYPEIFKKLILFNSHPYEDPEEKAVDRKREIDIIESGKLSMLASVSIPKMYSRSNLRKMDEKIRETVELCETHDPMGIVASIKGMQLRPNSSSLLSNSPVPAMVIVGDEDTFMPVSMIEEMRKSFPKVRLEELTGCGHNSFLERPDEVLNRVVSFIG
jgi:pimeloyl-ACP methyl ester carboxylesterase